MKVLIILIVLLVLSISFAGLKASDNITEMNGKIKAVWLTDAEESRDCINIRISTAQFKTNYFEYPNAFWVSDSIYHDSLYLNDIQNEIKLYVKTKYIPPSF
ncbi:MAG: hypothetical protein GY855_17715, partial [candidate division Zixibacteria bacterium]|nr:hypothetical protein [candidate division Zixibacteria bacterium]